MTRLFVIGSLLGAIALILDGRRRRARRAPAQANPDPGEAGAGPVGLAGERGDAAEPPPGIAQVDPEPLTQISAEGIDPDATRAAHEAIVDQRERLPVQGKNIP